MEAVKVKCRDVNLSIRSLVNQTKEKSGLVHETDVKLSEC